MSIPSKLPRRTPDPKAAGPLKDVRIVDLSRLVAGNMVTHALGDFGADVIKIERPGKGDDLRNWRVDGHSNFWKLYGRNKRVWCRYLCPVNGVFGLLAKLAPVHFAVDPEAWRAWPKHRGARAATMNCAPLVPVRTMQGNSMCHMCGRCSGFRDAVTLSRRSPNFEIVHVAGNDPKPVETLLIVFGLIGIAFGAFHWSSSALYVDVKQFLAEWLVDHDLTWPLAPVAPWWILTNYPDQNDMLTPLDGAVLLADIFTVALTLGGFVMLCLAGTTLALDRWSTPRLHHLAQALIPIAGCGVFLGLSALTVTMLRGEGLALDFVNPLRASLLVGAGLWSLSLVWQISALYAPSPARRLIARRPKALCAGASSGSPTTRRQAGCLSSKPCRLRRRSRSSART